MQPSPPADADETAFSVNRLASLSDGVFAVAMTLLAYNVHVARGPLTDAQVHVQLGGIVPDVMALILSISAAALFRHNHTQLLAVMRQSGRALFYPTLAFLLSVVFLPISTNLSGTLGATLTVALTYGGNLAVIAFLQLGLWLLTLAGQPSSRRARLVHLAPALYTCAVFATSVLIGLAMPTGFSARPPNSDPRWLGFAPT